MVSMVAKMVVVRYIRAYYAICSDSQRTGNSYIRKSSEMAGTNVGAN